MNHPPAPPQRRRAARHTPRPRRTLARLGGLAVFLAAAIGLAPAAWATSPPPAPSVAPPPAAAPAHFPPWAMAAILAATAVLSVATTLITLALEDIRRARLGRRAPAAATRRYMIGAAMCGAAILTVMLSHVQPGGPPDGAIAACTSLSGLNQAGAPDFRKVRAEFATSRWPDVRVDGTAYADLAIKLRTAQDTDGTEAAWFYQRLSTACARHNRNITADSNK